MGVLRWTLPGAVLVGVGSLVAALGYDLLTRPCHGELFSEVCYSDPILGDWLIVAGAWGVAAGVLLFLRPGPWMVSRLRGAPRPITFPRRWGAFK